MPNRDYCLFIIWQGKSERSDWFFLGRDFAIRTVSMEMVISCVFFLFLKADKLKTSMVRVPYNKLLTNLVSSSRTGEYNGPRSFFAQTSLHLVRTAMTWVNIPQYGPRARLVRGKYLPVCTKWRLLLIDLWLTKI